MARGLLPGPGVWPVRAGWRRGAAGLVLAAVAAVARAQEPPLDAAGGRADEAPSSGGERRPEPAPALNEATPVVEPPGAPPPADAPPPPAASAAPAPAPAPAAAARLIERVRLDEGPNGVVVRLATRGPAAAPHARVLPRKGRSPARIYVDVPDAALAPAARGEFRGRGGVTRVRTGQFDAKTARVVIELADAAPYEVRADADGASIVVRVPPAKKPPAEQPAVAKAAPAAVATTTTVPPPARAEPAEQPAPAEAGPAPAAPAVVYGPEPPPAPALGPPVLPDAAAADALAFAGADELGGAVFVWPALERADYLAPDAEPFRKALVEWRAGNVPDVVPRLEGRKASAAATYLAADLLYLEATAGRGDWWKPSLAYQAAVRDFPSFPDAPRAQFLLAHAELALGLGPEAGADFTTLERRWPESPYVGDAHLGLAAALRLRRRPEEARRVLQETRSHATGALACRAERERIAQARPTGATGEILEAFQKIEQLCPDVLRLPDEILAYADAKAANGDPTGARALLTASRPWLRRDDQARLLMAAGRIAAETGDRQAAEVEYALVAGMHPSLAIATELKMRRALLEGGRPEHLAATLASLAKEDVPLALRAVLLGEAAEQRARAGDFEEALAILDDLAALGRDGARQAEARRPEMLGRWIAATVAQGNDAAVAALYAAHATAIEEDAPTADRLAIAAALGRLGLHPAAVRLLLLTRAKLPEPDLDVEQALAEAAIAAGDQGVLRETLQRIVARPLPADQAERVRRTLARAALRTGDVETAASVAAQVADLAVRGEVAAVLVALPDGAPRARALVAPALQAVDAPYVALLAAGDAAAAAEAWDEAATAYDRALGVAEGAARLPAAAGLARAAAARNDRATATRALRVLEQGGDPLLARAATVAGRAVARLAAAEEVTP